MTGAQNKLKEILKGNHYVDILVRKNGQDVHFEGDFLKEFLDTPLEEVKEEHCEHCKNCCEDFCSPKQKQECKCPIDWKGIEHNCPYEKQEKVDLPEEINLDEKFGERFLADKYNQIIRYLDARKNT